MRHQWVSKEEQEKREAAVNAYLRGVSKCRAWLDTLSGSSPESMRDALEARIERVLEQPGPESLGWRDTLSGALERLTKSDVHRAKLRAVLLQYETSRAARVAAEERRQAQAKAAEESFRAGLRALDSATEQMRKGLKAAEERITLYDLRGVSKLGPHKREDTWRAQLDAEAQEAREWESYDANPYEPGEGDMEDPYWEERNAELLRMPD